MYVRGRIEFNSTQFYIHYAKFLLSISNDGCRHCDGGGAGGGSGASGNIKRHLAPMKYL